jgi:hypothetical protein
MPDIGVSCATCPFYVATNDTLGVCRYNPPTPFVLNGPPDLAGNPTVRTPSLWPGVNADAWCARHPLFDMTRAPVPVDSRLGGEAQGEA